MDTEKTGKLISERRKLKHMTQDELGEKLGVGGSSVSKWERGITAPDISLLNNIAKELDLSVNDLLTGKIVDNKPKAKKIIKTIILIILVSLIFIFSLLIISKTHKEEVYIISSNNQDITFGGNIMIGNEKSVLNINNFELENRDLNKLVMYYKVELKNKEDILAIYYYDSFENQNPMYLSSVIENTYIELIDNNKSQEEDLKINKENLDKMELYMEYMEVDSDNLNQIDLKMNIFKQ